MLTYLTLPQTTEWDNPRHYEIAALECAATFFIYLLPRGVSEGIIDSTRCPTSADVGR